MNFTEFVVKQRQAKQRKYPPVDEPNRRPAVPLFSRLAVLSLPETWRAVFSEDFAF